LQAEHTASFELDPPAETPWLDADAGGPHIRPPNHQVSLFESKSMAIAAERKTDLISKFRTHESDTGSPEVQIALLTERIQHLTEHFKTHSKDHHSRRGLLQLVSQRRRLLDYLMRSEFQRYRKVIKELNIRK
jgi:small subunit ribosomal protein S15